MLDCIAAGDDGDPEVMAEALSPGEGEEGTEDQESECPEEDPVFEPASEGGSKPAFNQEPELPSSSSGRGATVPISAEEIRVQERLIANLKKKRTALFLAISPISC